MGAGHSVGSCRTFKPGTSTARNFCGRRRKKEDPTSDSLNELVANFSEEEFARLALRKEQVGRRDRATAPATAAPMERAPSTRIGMFMPSTVPELRGRENFVAFMQRFRTWACVSRCDLALDSEIIVKMSETPLAN